MSTYSGSRRRLARAAAGFPSSQVRPTAPTVKCPGDIRRRASTRQVLWPSTRPDISAGTDLTTTEATMEARGERTESLTGAPKRNRPARTRGSGRRALPGRSQRRGTGRGDRAAPRRRSAVSIERTAHRDEAPERYPIPRLRLLAATSIGFGARLRLASTPRWPRWPASPRVDPRLRYLSRPSRSPRRTTARPSDSRRLTPHADRLFILARRARQTPSRTTRIEGSIGWTADRSHRPPPEEPP